MWCARYHPLDEGNETWLKREQLLHRIDDLPAICEPDQVFHSVLMSKDHAKLREFVRILSSRMGKVSI